MLTLYPNCFKAIKIVAFQVALAVLKGYQNIFGHFSATFRSLQKIFGNLQKSPGGFCRDKMKTSCI